MRGGRRYIVGRDCGAGAPVDLFYCVGYFSLPNETGGQILFRQRVAVFESFLTKMRRKRFGLQCSKVSLPNETDALNRWREYPDMPAQQLAAPVIHCPRCKVGTLQVWHDSLGLYHKCDHCDWDSLGAYKTKSRRSYEREDCKG
jgi:hypothetical protein